MGVNKFHLDKWIRSNLMVGLLPLMLSFFLLRELCVFGGPTSISSITCFSDMSDLFLWNVLCVGFLHAGSSSISVTESH